MGRVRVPGLDISLSHLQQEVATFHRFVSDPEWMTRDNYVKRRAVVDGLTFLMLNLSKDADQKSAWAVFHAALDRYHDPCDIWGLRY